MKIQGKTLIICPHDFDHIMDYDDNLCPSESFKIGLQEELFLSGLENKKYDEIKLEFGLEG